MKKLMVSISSLLAAGVLSMGLFLASGVQVKAAEVASAQSFEEDASSLDVSESEAISEVNSEFVEEEQPQSSDATTNSDDFVVQNPKTNADLKNAVSDNTTQYAGTWAHTQSAGWRYYRGSNENSVTIGTVGMKKRLEAFVMPYGMAGKVYMEGKNDWSNLTEAGGIVGSTGEGRRITAIMLYGNMRFRIQTSHSGWSGWYTSGELAGTPNSGVRIEAIQIERI